MKMPLNCFWLSSQPGTVTGSQDSVSTPSVLSVVEVTAASASTFASASADLSPVARHTSTAPPMARPWLYVHTVWPLFVQSSVSPSLTRLFGPIRPLCRYQFHAVLARASQVLRCVRSASEAASRTYRPLVMAFLYVLSVFHQTPPPHVLGSQ